MANSADTIYKITGSRKAVNALWTTLQKMEVHHKIIELDQLAKFYGIDYEKKQISVRGNIYFAEMDTDDKNDRDVLTIETETAWSGCHDLFREISSVLWGELVINYQEIENGCGIYCVHDEEGFFPEECCVSSCGEPFEDVYGDVFDTVEEAIKEWCDKTGVSPGERSQDEMIAFINDYEYENEDTHFYINRFVHE